MHNPRKKNFGTFVSKQTDMRKKIYKVYNKIKYHKIQ